MLNMRRRQFITLLGGAARALPNDRVPHIGVLLSIADSDPDAPRRIQAPKPPSGALWLHEIKHRWLPGHRPQEGEWVKPYSRPGNDLTAGLGPGCARAPASSMEAVDCGVWSLRQTRSARTKSTEPTEHFRG